MPFAFNKLEIPDVILIIPKAFEDDRGFFMESFKSSEFKKFGVDYDFVQDNHSKSKKGVFRGLHYQLNPKAQGKLVRVVAGSMLDIALDIRKGSPYYGKYLSVILSAENKNILWVPPGFAHGTFFLEDDTELLYKATDEYSPEHDRCIAWNDPAVGIRLQGQTPVLSAKDSKAPLLKDADNNFIYNVKK
jgi:dTDP-4-dehydrorhamnose 3,5-epimerase